VSEFADAFATAAAASGAHVHRDVDPAEIVAGRSADEVGVSHALYGLADTGSVVLAAAPDEPRARSLLPPVHVTILDEERILPGLPDLFAVLGTELPSALAIVTGPSRSADIEQRLVIGVHGPGEVHIVLRSADGRAGEAHARPTRVDWSVQTDRGQSPRS
jgi:L-lactate dehydrogenase complex protein LldG